MKERPILFSPPMVRAILDGSKTMTRRLVKPQPGGSIEDCYHRPDGLFIWLHFPQGTGVGIGNPFSCPHGKIGDRLWVRETWYYEYHMHDIDDGEPDLPDGLYSRRLIYRATYPEYPVDIGVGPNGWRPSIHMPRWASRILLEIEEVRAERLQDINEYDAQDEGVEGINTKWLPTYIANFSKLWNSLNAKRGYGWDTDPWVWVIRFKILKPAPGLKE